ncbi:MAG: hypothetical protein V4484_01105 [Pseudomonadota bacterium]
MKLPIKLLLCAAASAIVYWGSGMIEELAGMRLPFTIVTSGLLWVKTLAPLLVEVLPAIRRRAISDAWEPWNGRYYAFDNRQIRLYLIEDIIWVPARDVATMVLPQPASRELRILGAEYGAIPGQPKLQGYTEAGLLRLLSTRASVRQPPHDLVRFKHWLEKEAFPNIRRLPGSATP